MNQPSCPNCSHYQAKGRRLYSRPGGKYRPIRHFFQCSRCKILFVAAGGTAWSPNTAVVFDPKNPPEDVAEILEGADDT